MDQSHQEQPGTLGLIDFKSEDEIWKNAGLDTETVKTLSAIMPAIGAKMLDEPDDS